MDEAFESCSSADRRIETDVLWPQSTPPRSSRAGPGVRNLSVQDHVYSVSTDVPSLIEIRKCLQLVSLRTSDVSSGLSRVI